MPGLDLGSNFRTPEPLGFFGLQALLNFVIYLNLRFSAFCVNCWASAARFEG